VLLYPGTEFQGVSVREKLYIHVVVLYLAVGTMHKSPVCTQLIVSNTGVEGLKASGVHEERRIQHGYLTLCDVEE
jgi:hypothetical protein